jgi:hypothetical protein
MLSPDSAATHTFDFSPAELADLTSAAEIARAAICGGEADALSEAYARLLTAEQTQGPVVVSPEQLDALVCAVEIARAQATGDADEQLLPLYRRLLAAQIS